MAAVPTLANVTLVATEPLKLPVADKPAPNTKLLGVAAVIVTEPPNEIPDPLIVTELLVKELLPMLLNVFDAPLIVLLVSV